MVCRWLTQLGLVMALGIGSTGCMSIGAVQTAQTLGAGNYEVSLEPGVYGAASSQGNSTEFTSNIAFRFGLSDRFDLGARVGSLMAEVQTKILLSSPDNDGFALSLAPSIGGFGFGLGIASFGVLSIPIPVLIGFKFGQHELTFGPRIQNMIVFGSVDAGSSGNASGSLYVMMGGVSVGFAAQLAERFRLLPEISVATPFLGGISGSSGSSSGSTGFVAEAGGVLYMGNLGVQFTSPRKKRAPKAQPVQ